MPMGAGGPDKRPCANSKVRLQSDQAGTQIKQLARGPTDSGVADTCCSQTQAVMSAEGQAPCHAEPSEAEQIHGNDIQCDVGAPSSGNPKTWNQGACHMSD